MKPRTISNADSQFGSLNYLFVDDSLVQKNFSKFFCLQMTYIVANTHDSHGTTFHWDLETLGDRLLGRNGADLGDAVDAAGAIAGAGVQGATQSIMAQIEPWVGRVAIIVLAFVLIAGALAMLANAPKVTESLQGAMA